MNLTHVTLRWNAAFFLPIREVFPDLLWSNFNFGLRAVSLCLDDGFRADRWTPGGYSGYNYEGFNCSASSGAVVGNVDAGSIFYYGYGGTSGAYSLGTASEAALVQRARSVAAVEYNLRADLHVDGQPVVQLQGSFPWISYASLCFGAPQGACQQRPAVAAERGWYVEMLFHLAMSGATGFNYWNPWAMTINSPNGWPPPAPGDDALLSESLSTLTNLSALGLCRTSAEPRSAVRPPWDWVVDCGKRHADDFLLSGVELHGCPRHDAAGRLWRLSLNSSRTAVQRSGEDIVVHGVDMGSEGSCDLIFKKAVVVEAGATMMLGSVKTATATAHRVQLEPPNRIAHRTPEPGDKYNNGSNAGVLWFPHAISTLPSGVLLLRIAVHPDADMPYNHATLLTSKDRGKTFVSQTPDCSNANVAACSLPYFPDATGHSAAAPRRFGPTRSWEMAVPASTCSETGLAVAGDRVLVAGYQSHLLGDGTIVGFDGTELIVSSDGTVSVLTPAIPITVHGLPHPIKDLNYTGCKSCGQPVDPPTSKRRLASAHASNAAPINLKGGVGLVTLLTDVAFVSGTTGCIPSKAKFGPRCQYVLAIKSADCGINWQFLSVVTADGNEAGMLQLADGRLMVVHRHDFDSTTPGDGVAYKHTFSRNGGVSWTDSTLMTAAADSVVPHSVMPTLRNMPGGGVLLSGGRGGMYLWYCSNLSCVDKGLWVSTNVAASHNKLVSPADPFGPFPSACVNESAWRQLNSCPSKEYLGLAALQPAVAAEDANADEADFVVCYGHCGKVSQYGWCFTELGPGQEVYCARGSARGRLTDGAGSSISKMKALLENIDDGVNDNNTTTTVAAVLEANHITTILGDVKTDKSADKWLVQDGYNAVSNDKLGKWPHQPATSMADCQAACLKRANCGVIAFSQSTGSCYFRADNIWGATSPGF
jgi:hypothetical protein